MVKKELQRLKLMSLGLALMVSACATSIAPPPNEPESFPELPAQGRVSLIPTPSECSPSCLSGLTRERKSSAAMLTGFESPGASVSGLGTLDYSLSGSPKGSRTGLP